MAFRSYIVVNLSLLRKIALVVTFEDVKSGQDIAETPSAARIRYCDLTIPLDPNLCSI